MYTTLKIINRKFLRVSLIWTFFSHVGAIFFKTAHKLHDHILEEMENSKYLGVTINNKLNWTQRAVLKKIAPTCEKNVQIKLTRKNFLLIIFNVVYIEVNETRKKV
jgi:hypothetical protein